MKSQSGKLPNKQDRQFDRIVSFEVLRQCGMASTVDKSLLKYINNQPIVAKAISYQCCYVASILREVKHKLSQGKAGSPFANSNKLVQSMEGSGCPTAVVSSASQLNISIIGCGEIGTEILDALISTRLFHSTCFIVSTRQPDTLSQYSKIGINICYNNILAAECSDLLILACLPTHLQDVCAGVQGKLKPNCVVMSCLVGVTVSRLRSILSHRCCWTTVIHIPSLSGVNVEDESSDVQQIRVSCPFYHQDVLYDWVRILLDVTRTHSTLPIVSLSAVVLSIFPKEHAIAVIEKLFSATPLPRKDSHLLDRWGGVKAMDVNNQSPESAAVEKFIAICDGQ